MDDWFPASFMLCCVSSPFCDLVCVWLPYFKI